jgi:hypothetical protein
MHRFNHAIDSLKFRDAANELLVTRDILDLELAQRRIALLLVSETPHNPGVKERARRECEVLRNNTHVPAPCVNTERWRGTIAVRGETHVNAL